MSSEQMNMLLELQTIGLALGDLLLYLDTHPYDDMAKKQFNMTVADMDKKTAVYEQQFGPLMQGSMAPDVNGFAWALTDFPWNM